MRRAVGLEFRKMHRLHTVPITIVLVLAVVALSCAFLFSGSARETFEDPSAAPWAALLLTYTMVAAMTSPILAAVAASRQTDIEHSGSGWILAGTAGVSPGLLCRAKLTALSLFLFPAILIQSLLVVVTGSLVGIRVPINLGHWAGYTLLLFLVDVAFCAFHVLLAAAVENQLVSVGLGVLGGFIAVFLLLMPGWPVRFLPWGYYSMISNVTQSGNDVVYIWPAYVWVAGFLLVAGVAFTFGSRQLDRKES